MARPSFLLSLLAACAPEERVREAPSPAEPAFVAVAAPPTVVHPYYTTDAKRWAEGATLRIRP